MLRKEDDLRTASALQRDQTDDLHEMQKWATKECQNETQLPGRGLLPIIRQGKAAQHPGSGTLPCAKAAVTGWPLGCPHVPAAVAQTGTTDLPQAEPGAEPRHGDRGRPAPTTGLHFLLEG